MSENNILLIIICVICLIINFSVLLASANNQEDDHIKRILIAAASLNVISGIGFIITYFFNDTRLILSCMLLLYISMILVFSIEKNDNFMITFYVFSVPAIITMAFSLNYDPCMFEVSSDILQEDFNDSEKTLLSNIYNNRLQPNKIISEIPRSTLLKIVEFYMKKTNENLSTDIVESASV